MRQFKIRLPDEVIEGYGLAYDYQSEITVNETEVIPNPETLFNFVSKKIKSEILSKAINGHELSHRREMREKTKLSQEAMKDIEIESI